MLLLIIISISGLLLSTAIHIGSLLHIYEPPRWLLILIYMGFLIVFYPACIIQKKARQEKNAKEFRKDILGVCPEWLLTTSGLIIMYGLGWFIFFIYKRYFDVSVPTNWQRIGFTSAFWMASYSLNFALLYICRCLKERTLADGD